MSRHTLRIVLGAFAGLLVVPVAVNIGTGGDAPPWLKPYVNWLWPLAIACVVLVIGLELLDKKAPKGAMSIRRPNDPRNVDLALTQVAQYVDARRSGMLAEHMRIALALDEHPEAVRQPVHLVQRVSGDEFQLSAKLTVLDVFTQMNESMLILGAPGAGKTTQLLDLAKALIAQARAATNPSIPVVVDLADWVLSEKRGLAKFAPATEERALFDVWLLRSLADRYKIPEEVGRLWLTEDRLTLLLDGLDEVPEGARELAAAEINALQQRHGVTRVAVCSREADYASMHTRLQLQGAVVIRPLGREQVHNYLVTVSPELADVVALLESDEELWDLITTPLMLAIMVLARVDQGSQALTADAEPMARRRLLFDAYVVEVLARRRSNEQGKPQRVLRALRTLAIGSTSQAAGVRVPPLDYEKTYDFLPEPVKGVASRWIASVASMTAAFAWTAATAIHFNIWASVVPVLLGLIGLSITVVPARVAPIRQWLLFLGVALGSAVVSAVLAVAVDALFDLSKQALALIGATAMFLIALAVVVAGLRETALTAKSSMREQLVVVLVGIVAAGAVLLIGMSEPLLHGWLISTVIGTWLMAGPVFSPTVESGPDSPASAWRVAPVQIFGYLGACLALMAWLGSSTGNPWWPILGMVIGLPFGLSIGVIIAIAAGNPLIRLAMRIAGEPVPWRRSFLRFAADRSLLTHADGEYWFIHLLVRDHLAACDPDRLGLAVIRRRAELAQTRATQPSTSDRR